MKRVFLVHCWGGKPSGGWYSWVENELKKRGFQVVIPAMPNPDVPEISAWVNMLAKAVGTPTKEDIFIGHSVGCQAILRYVEKVEKPVAGIYCIAPWFHLQNLESKEAEEIIRPWLTTGIDLKKVKKNAKKIAAFFSDDDPFVPMSDAKIFEKELNAKVIIEKKKGHFTEDDGVTAGANIPALLNEILSVAK